MGRLCQGLGTGTNDIGKIIEETRQNCNPLKQSKTQVNQLQTEPDPKHSHKNIRHPHTQERWQQNF